MLLGTLPNKLLFDKFRVVMTLSFPISSESGPFRRLDDKSRFRIYSSPHKVDGIVEVNKLGPNDILRATEKLYKQEG